MIVKLHDEPKVLYQLESLERRIDPKHPMKGMIQNDIRTKKE